MDDERTTQEVIHLLGEDVERCHGALLAAIDAGERDADGNVDADYEFHAHQLIRTVFAYIEATTFSVKASSAWKCMEEDIDIPPSTLLRHRYRVRHQRAWGSGRNHSEGVSRQEYPVRACPKSKGP